MNSCLNLPPTQGVLELSIGEMAEWSNALVLKTSVPRGTGGSNPSSSAIKSLVQKHWAFFI